MSTADDVPEAARANRLIPVRLIPTLCVYLAALGIYATFAAMRAAYGAPLPDLLHNSAQFVFAVTAVAWLVALDIVKQGERMDALSHEVAYNRAALSAILANPTIAALLHPSGSALGDDPADASVYHMPPPEIRDAVTRIKQRIGAHPEA